jgi:sec-independent protein translocase protein TatA
MTALVMGLPGGMEWVILLVVALLLFGGSRIAGMGKGAGRAIREFKEEIKAPTGVEATKAAEAEDLSKPVDAEIVAPEPRKVI